MASFNSVPFKVKTADSDGNWPAPVRQNDGTVTYQADILVFGASNYTALQAALTRGTLKPVAGANVSNYYVEAGVGPKALVAPLYRGVSKTFPSAVLTRFEPKGSGVYPGSGALFFATVEFAILSTITP